MENISELINKNKNEGIEIVKQFLPSIEFETDDEIRFILLASVSSMYGIAIKKETNGFDVNVNCNYTEGVGLNNFSIVISKKEKGLVSNMKTQMANLIGTIDLENYDFVSESESFQKIKDPRNNLFSYRYESHFCFGGLNMKNIFVKHFNKEILLNFFQEEKISYIQNDLFEMLIELLGYAHIKKNDFIFKEQIFESIRERITKEGFDQEDLKEYLELNYKK
jgi:hypothetical protein